MANGLWVSANQFKALSGKKLLSTEIATTENSIDYWSLLKTLPNPDYTLKKAGKDIAVYEELLAETRVSSCVSSRMSGITSLEWGIGVGQDETEVSKFVKSVFDNFDLDNLIREILRATIFGYQPLEVIWAERDGRFIIDRIVGKPQRWFEFNTDRALCMKPKTGFSDGTPVPDYKFLVPRHNASYDNPYGDAILSKVFWPVTFKKGGMTFWVQFVEKYGMPLVLGKYPSGTSKDDVDNFVSAIVELRQGGFGAISENTSLELLDGVSESNINAFRELVNYCNTDIAISILGQNLTTEVNGGSLAAAQAHMEVRKDLIDNDRKIVQRTLNTAIEWLVKLNYGTSTDAPKFSLWKEEDVDTALAERDKTLHDAGVRFSKTYLQKAYGFKEDDVDIADESQQQPQQVAAAQFAESGIDAEIKRLKLYQGALDNGIDSITAAELQRQASGILRPIIELIQTSTDYAEALDNLTAVYPDMNQKSLQDMLARAIFVSTVIGQQSVNSLGEVVYK